MTKRPVRGVSGKLHCCSLSTLLEINLPHRRELRDDILTLTLRRYKKRKGMDDTQEENDEDSTVFSDEDMGTFPSDGEDEQETSDGGDDDEEVSGRTTTRPNIITHWNSRDLDSFHGSGLFYTSYWSGRRFLGWWVERALENAQRSLVARQDQTSIALEYEPAHQSQVPYRECRVLFCLSKPIM